jgi:GDSL-like Lipase/Acylhydrolase family
VSARRLLGRAGLVAAALLAALLGTELVLRAAGAVPDPPLFVPGPDGRLHVNPEHDEVVDVSVDAHPSRLRIAWVGDSTVLGVPYDPVLSPPRWLQWVLQSRGVPAEVVGVAGTGLDSTQVAELVRGVLELRPDAVVVTTGHNEYLNVGPALHPHWWHRFALGRRLEQALSPPPGPPGPGEEPDHQAITARFAAQLQAMVAACADDGVPLLFTAPVCNLADMPPVLGGAAPGGDADAAWQAGHAALAAGDVAAARAAFTRARDLDRWPHRATSPLCAELRARAPHLVPTDSLFEQASASGVPGAELFADHCHPDPAGQRLLAIAVADGVEDLRLAPPSGHRGQAPPLAEGLAALHADADLQPIARAQVGRVFAGLALLREQPGPLAALAGTLLEDPSVEASVPAADLAASRALLAVARHDAAEARRQIAAAAARPEALAKLRQLYQRYAWVAAAFERVGVAAP